MTPSVSPADRDYLAHVEAQARAHETIAGKYRDVASMLREILGVSTIAAPGGVSDVRMELVATDRAIALLKTPDAAPVDFHPLDPDPFRVPSRAPMSTDAARAHADVPPRRAHQQPHELSIKILAKVTEAGGEIRCQDLINSVGSNRSVVRYHIAQLLADQRLLKRGRTVSTVYFLPPAAPPAAPVPELTRADPPPTVAVVGTDAWRAKVSFLLLRDVLTNAPIHVGDIVIALSETLGVAPYADVVVVLDALIAEGAVRLVMKGREKHYAKTTDRVSRADLKGTLLREAFNGPSSWSMTRLTEMTRADKGGTGSDLGRVLDELVREGRIAVRTVGSERHYARKAS